MEEEFLSDFFILLCGLYYLIKIQHGRVRRWKVRPINTDWYVGGYERSVFQKIKKMDPEQLFKHTRMTLPLFEMLICITSSALRKPKQRIGPEERVSLTLLYLAHGVPIQALAWSYKLGKTTVRNIILETCDVFWSMLSPTYVAEPNKSKYEDIAEDFYSLWNIPNCVGAIDGKHIAMKCPPNSGTTFYNYKKFFSIVLMATCDAKYTFTAVSIGGYGSQHDGGIFRMTPFGEALLGNTLPLPDDIPLGSSTDPFPHFFVADAAFPLRRNLMRPYAGASSALERPKRIFNYRHSRARRVIENSFGILTARWRVLRTTIECLPENAERVVLACIALHNFVMLNDIQSWYCPNNYFDWEDADNRLHNGGWRSDLSEDGGPLRSIRTHDRRGSASAFQLRDELMRYFTNEGAVPFQERIDIEMNGPYASV